MVHYKTLIEDSTAQFKERCASVAEELGADVAIMFPSELQDHGGKFASKASRTEKCMSVATEEQRKPLRADSAPSLRDSDLWGSDDEAYDA